MYSFKVQTLNPNVFVELNNRHSNRFKCHSVHVLISVVSSSDVLSASNWWVKSDFMLAK